MIYLLLTTLGAAFGLFVSSTLNHGPNMAALRRGESRGEITTLYGSTIILVSFGLWLWLLAENGLWPLPPQALFAGLVTHYVGAFLGARAAWWYWDHREQRAAADQASLPRDWRREGGAKGDDC